MQKFKFMDPGGHIGILNLITQEICVLPLSVRVLVPELRQLTSSWTNSENNHKFNYFNMISMYCNLEM